LTKIAEITDGRYFRATDSEELAKIYEQIDALEKTRVEQQTFVNYTDRFPWFLLPALGIFILELALGQTALREIP
jgi:Ca-activated chloride channel family protein